jgi:hypothetical protein
MKTTVSILLPDRPKEAEKADLLNTHQDGFDKPIDGIHRPGFFLCQAFPNNLTVPISCHPLAR